MHIIQTYNKISYPQKQWENKGIIWNNILIIRKIIFEKLIEYILLTFIQGNDKESIAIKNLLRKFKC